MPHSVLGRVTLGYEPIWNAQRRHAGTRLWVESEANAGAQAHHLLETLSERWPESAGPLLLSLRSAALRDGVMEHPGVPGIWVEVENHWLDDARCAQRVRQAHQRGLRMVWRGASGHTPAPDIQHWFHKTLHSLTPQQALGALRAARQPQSERNNSPVVKGALYEGLPSAALVGHALDQQRAWGVLGWPSDEILHRYRTRQIQPSRPAILALLQAIDADEALNEIARRIEDEPLLCYRFLRYVNSAALGLVQDIGSLHLGLMALGYHPLRTWLAAQLHQAGHDPDLDPIRAHLVLRARTMAHLTEAGRESDLRREAFLCGIFSQIDLLLGEPLGNAMHRLPLPGRVTSAIVGQTGPYAAWLQVASALESGSTRLVREVCQAHQLAAADVNRALLRALTSR